MDTDAQPTHGHRPGPTASAPASEVSGKSAQGAGRMPVPTQPVAPPHTGAAPSQGAPTRTGLPAPPPPLASTRFPDTAPPPANTPPPQGTSAPSGPAASPGLTPAPAPPAFAPTVPAPPAAPPLPPLPPRYAAAVTPPAPHTLPPGFTAAADSPATGIGLPPKSAAPTSAPASGTDGTRGRRRADGVVGLVSGLGARSPFARFARPARRGPDDHLARLRPVPGARLGARTAAAAVCAVLGLGLIGGAVTGNWLTGDSAAAAGPQQSYQAAGDLWHSVPVDRLFPPVVRGAGAGPGGADRRWTRIGIAPDADCKQAFDPLLRKVLAPVGCDRLLRATYTDATRSHVTTVGLLFTEADAGTMTALRDRLTTEHLDRRPDLMPRPYPVRGTPAAAFGDRQRGSWALSVLTDAPVVVYAVSGFADGRTVADPQPAAEAMRSGATTAPAQSGLGNEVMGLSDQIEHGLRRAAEAADTADDS
ncbi:hypothetical protein [Streptomyces sp. NPDC058045]|uniref:hypothetical protein n=1 Tax=Streptomyces sp. NPDC058045 TaxID=3346311 RepID=UPI0036DFFEFC